MISKFYTETVTVLRDEWTDESGIETSEISAVGTLAGHVQQVSAEELVRLGGNITLSHALYAPCGSDIVVGDTLLINDFYYTVSAIHNYCFVGTNKHLKCYIEQGAAYEDNS